MERLRLQPRRLVRPALIVEGLLLTLVGSGCFLDRSALPGPPERFDVVPAMVCPGETVHLSWSVRTTEGCQDIRDGRTRLPGFRCSYVTSVTSDPPVISRSNPPNPGEADAVVSEDTTFTANVTYCEPRGDYEACTRPYDVSREVQVIDGAGEVPLLFEGQCTGWSAAFLPDMSACLRMERICAQVILRGQRVRVQAYKPDHEVLGDPVTLTNDSPCASAADFQDARYFSASLAGPDVPIPIPGSGSTECLSELPPILLNLHVGCNADCAP